MSSKPWLTRRQTLALLGALGVGSDVLANPAAGRDPARVDPWEYKVVFENDKVRVLEFKSEPSGGVCGRGRHWHPPHISMQLSPVKVRVTTESGATSFVEVPAGTVFYEPAVTHTTENIGGRPSHAYIVELKDACWAPSTGTT